MVAVELRTPDPSAPGGWDTAVALRVDGDRWQLHGDERLLDFDLPVLNRRTGRQLRFDEDPEEWARNLETAYHAPDLIAVVVDDTNPLPPDPPVERQRVELPEAVSEAAGR